LLKEGRCAISQTPTDRWSASLRASAEKEPGKVTANCGAFLDAVDQFDATFFGISPRETESLDPQHRLLLEVAWETLEHAGIDPHQTRDSRTGVFLGICSNDYVSLLGARDRTRIDAYLGTGNAHSTAAGRLSYFMHWQGPSVAIDTACSSSLTALHMAVRSLRYGDCDMALVAGVNLILAPELSITLSQAGMLSPTGLCRTFDASADGFVRGEGCGALLLKRLSRAQADGDRIVCLVRGSAVNQDGRSNGLTAPNGISQQDVIRSALADAGVAAEQIDYLEAHGTGTELGDPIEMRAITEVFVSNTERRRALRVGSVKTNIGHLEGAAGIAGAIKVCLAMEHQAITPHLHFREPSSLIEWNPLIDVNTGLTDWPAGERRRLAGVSSFGFGGSNAHAVFEEPPRTDRQAEDERRSRQRQGLLTLSARSPTALRRKAAQFAEALAEEAVLTDFCATANAGRAHFEYRLATPVDSARKAAAQLTHFSTIGHAEGVWTSAGLQTADTVWLFGDERLQLGDGRRLYERHPAFRAALDRCSELFAQQSWPSLESALWEDSHLLEGYARLPALFCLQYATAQLWLSFGISPEAVVGHDLGEYAAACIAGVLSLEDAFALLAKCVATEGPDHRGGALQPAYEQYASGVSFGRPRCPYFSTADGQIAPNEIARASYWVRRSDPTERRNASWRASLPKDAFWLDFGAGSRLRADLSDGAVRGLLRAIPQTMEELDECQMTIESVAQLYVAGASIDWRAFEGIQRSRARLPTYPFERKRYWVKVDAPRPAESTSAFADEGRLPLLGQRLDVGGREIIFETDLSRFDYLASHCIGSSIVFPASGFLELALSAGRSAATEPCDVADLKIEQPISWEQGNACRVHTALLPSDSGYDVRIACHGIEGWRTCAVGRLVRNVSADHRRFVVPSANGHSRQFDLTNHYRRCRDAGLAYGAAFQGLRRLVGEPGAAWGEASLPQDIDQAGYIFHPVLLDACFQVCAAAFDDEIDAAYLPVRIGRYAIARSPNEGEILHVHATITPAGQDAGFMAELYISDSNGDPVAEVEQLSLVPTKRKTLNGEQRSNCSERAGQSPLAVILELPEGERFAGLQAYLRGRLAFVMGAPCEEIPVDKRLDALGLDSMMAFELRGELERDLDVEVPIETFLHGFSLADLTTKLMHSLQADDGSPRMPHDGAARSGHPSRDHWIEGTL
jgi:acyl transferase domain-containing protein/acyl carrier protein